MTTIANLYIGDTVLYHFKSYIRHGSSDLELRVRPAIITSIEQRKTLAPDTDPRLLNLHVLFEDRDFITASQRAFSAADSLLVFQRSQVPYFDGVPADNRWALTERMAAIGNRRPAWALGDLP